MFEIIALTADAGYTPAVIETLPFDVAVERGNFLESNGFTSQFGVEGEKHENDLVFTHPTQTTIFIIRCVD